MNINETCRNGHARGTFGRIAKSGIWRCLECESVARINKRMGILKEPLRTLRAEDRLEARIDKTPGHGPQGTCWIYRGSKTKGYGTISRNGRQIYAHRLAYEIAFGVFHEELDVCHHCDFPLCCRPDHLFLGDAKANVKDMLKKHRHWLQLRRGDTHFAKLSWQTVHAIRAERNAGACRKEVAAKYNITIWTVSDITSHQTWKEVQQ